MVNSATIKEIIEYSKKFGITYCDNNCNVVKQWEYRPLFEFNGDMSIKKVDFQIYKVIE